MPREGGPPGPSVDVGCADDGPAAPGARQLLTAAAAPTLTILWLVPGLLLFGISRPAVFTPASSGTMAEIPEEDRPIAASLVTEARQLGAVIGVSVVGVVADFAGRGTPQEATVGFIASMVATAAVTAVALFGVLRGMRRLHPSG